MKRLRVLLEQEQRALRSADLPELVKLGPRKEQLLDRLEATRPEGPDAMESARQLQAQAHRNARLFEAALQGLGDAQALIRRLGAEGEDQTYRRDGMRQKVNPPGQTFEKRA